MTNQRSGHEIYEASVEEQRARKYMNWPSWHHLGRKLTIEEKKNSQNRNILEVTYIFDNLTAFGTHHIFLVASVRRNGQFIWLAYFSVDWALVGLSWLACSNCLLRKLPTVQAAVSSSVFEGVSFSEMRIKLMKWFVYRSRRFFFFFSFNDLPNFNRTGNGLIFIYLFEIFCGSFDAINGLLIIGT